MANSIKKIESLNTELKNIFSKMSISTRYKLVGSSSLLPNIFTTDYDLNDSFSKSGNVQENFHNLWVFFKHFFRMCKKNKSLWITDFKCGMKDNVPIRWSYEDIIKGEKENISFIEALQQKSRIKLDVIFRLNSEFVEISMIYYISVGDIKNFNDEEFETKTRVEELKRDINIYTKEHNYIKVLKRKFSLFKLEDTKIQLQEKLLDFFNSAIGLLYKSVVDLKTIILLKEQIFRRVYSGDLFEFQQIIKQNLSIVDIPYIYSALDRNKLSIKCIDIIIKKLEKIINKECKNEFGFLLP